MRFRPPAATDEDALLRFFRSLSDRSLYLRFHGHPDVSGRLVRPVLDPDWVERGALVGTHEGRIVAVANYVRLRDVRTAEVAFAVADDFQRRGIGTRLLEQLAAVATEVGIEEFVAEVMPDNTAMLRVFTDAGFETTRETVLGTPEVHLTLGPTETLRVRVDERDHVGVVTSLAPFFDPKTIAVIGASPRTGSIGGELFRNVLRAEYTGVAYPVNRSGASRRGGARVHERRGDRRADRSGRGVPAGLESDRCGARSAGRRCAGAVRRSRRGSPRRARKESRVRRSCSSWCAATARACSGPTASASPSPRRGSMRRSDLGRYRPATSASRRRAAHSGSPCSSARRSGGSVSRRSCRSGTRPTSRRTTCSNTGKTIRKPTLSCCTSSPSAIPGSSDASHVVSHARSRSSR